MIRTDDEIFTSQKCVDEYFEKTRDLANDVDTEECAITLLKRIKYLDHASDSFFVPKDIYGWEEMALSYVEDAKVLFQHVHYAILLENYQEFFNATHDLEKAVTDGLLEEDVLFSLVNDFNINLIQTNKLCEQYEMKKFDDYHFQNDNFNERYLNWLKYLGCAYGQ